ncbi:hypothetical protein IV203_038160 [Nitzschia inconspicua]|uniref:Uncharacterized protein n=1 Tax=Nitzschia inconspicua TaxID=303405 RepID=A0A9K3LMR3_9STRA|nr:hypothetical protein IV203_038160 [Nitzschia inconspicua]
MSHYDMAFDDTKRCLFPEESDVDYDSDSDSSTSSSSSLDEEGSSEKEDDVVTSPTSVVNILPDFASSKSTTIVMGEEGAEVALKDTTNLPPSCTDISNTPSKLQFDRMDASRKRGTPLGMGTASLLDVEKTPMRTPPTVQRQSQLTPSDCVCFGCDEAGHAFVERTITTFLEHPTAEAASPFQTSCTDWQAWSYFFGSPNQPRHVSSPSPSKENIRSVLRHRASQSLRARKTAVRQLSKDLAPFVNSPARSPARAPSLFRNRSFSVSDHRSAIVRVSKDRESNSKSSFSDVLQLCTMPENATLDSGDLLKFGLNHSMLSGMDDSGCYDSDPEEFTRRRHRLSFADDLTGSENLYQQRGLHSLTSHSPSRAFMDVQNDEVFSTIVEEIFNQTTTLVLHCRNPDSTESHAPSAGLRPVAIDAWLERGQNLAHKLIQPKWMWKHKPREVRGTVKLSNNPSLQAVELLDITRILKLEDLDENKLFYSSFAKSAHCFVVKTIHGEEFCYEAPNQSERDRLVYSLKLVIARFGAKVLVGDPQVYWEFFSMGNAAVPGHAPDICVGRVLTDDEEKDDLWRSDSSDQSDGE